MAGLGSPSMRKAAQGEIMKAMKSENNMASDAPTGIGRMYGPINPATKAMGRMAAITAQVASMVGLPTSSTASTATSASGRPFILRQVEVPGDVLHHHNGVVHQNSNGEDQGKQGDAVQRVAIDEIDK